MDVIVVYKVDRLTRSLAAVRWSVFFLLASCAINFGRAYARLVDTRAKLDQVVEDCAAKYGLRT